MLPISNEQFQVAICYYQPIPKYVDAGHGKEYVFDCKWSVSLCWVNPEDAPAILGQLGGCCGQHQPVFHYASPGEVQVWKTGHY